MSNGIPRLLFLDNAKCHIPTDHTSLNSRDEVYFLVAGGTSGGQQIKVAPDPDHNDEDYYPGRQRAKYRQHRPCPGRYE